MQKKEEELLTKNKLAQAALQKQVADLQVSLTAEKDSASKANAAKIAAVAKERDANRVAVQKKEEAYRERLEAKRQARKGSAADVKSSFAKNGRAEWDALGGKGFSIEDRDKAQLSPEEKQRRETKIMAAIRERVRRSKVVLVDDVAVDVGLDPMDVTGHVEELVGKGRLSGVVDSAEGKFIHITEAEMEKVAAFIRAKGRFSVQEFCEESGRLIDLR